MENYYDTIVITLDGKPQFCLITELPVLEDEEAAKETLNRVIKEEYSNDFTFLDHNNKGYIYKFNMFGTIRCFNFVGVMTKTYLPDPEDCCPEKFFEP